ncbi:MAG TPA: flippase [Bacteroidia bacterium]|nr:flippase [Bacteroidia bacterium]
MYIANIAGKIKQRVDGRLQDKSLRELLKGTSSTFSIRVIGFIVGYIFIIIISRFYGPGIVGIFTLSSTVLIIFSVAGRLGFDSSIVRFFAQNVVHNKWDVVQELYKKILKIVIPWGIFLSVVLFFSSSLIAENFFHKPQLTPYLKIISVAVLPMTLRFINSESYRGFKQMKQYAYSQNVSYFLYASVLLTAVSVFYKSDFLPNICFAVSLVILSVSSTILILKKIKSHVHSRSESITMREMLRISTPMMLSTSLMLISGWINTVMLGIYGTEADVGIYNVIFKIGAFTHIILNAVNSIAAPKFAELHALNDQRGLAKVAIQTSKINFWASLPVFIAIIIFRRYILEVFGSEFTVAADLLLFTMIGQFVNIFSGSVGTFLNMTGHQNVQRTIVLISTVINVIACMYFIPRYGLMGSVISSTIFLCTWNIMSLLYIKIKLNIQTFYFPFSKSNKENSG